MVKENAEKLKETRKQNLNITKLEPWKFLVGYWVFKKDANQCHRKNDVATHSIQHRTKIFIKSSPPHLPSPSRLSGPGE